jgi:hypothetical protein
VRHRVEGKTFAELLTDPTRAGLLGDCKVDDAAPLMQQNDEQVQATEVGRRDHAEIDCRQAVGMIAEVMFSAAIWRMSRRISVASSGRPGLARDLQLH